MKKSNVYTKMGDKGLTSLASGQTVDKSSVYLNLYGTIDEANAHLGFSISLLEDDEYLERVLTIVSHRLFNCSSIVAYGNAEHPRHLSLTLADIKYIEQAIDYLDAKCPSLKGFVLCSGSPLSASLHICRTVIRRVERLIYTLEMYISVSQELKMFINRLSDLFFVAARYSNHRAKKPETLWDHPTCK